MVVEDRRFAFPGYDFQVGNPGRDENLKRTAILGVLLLVSAASLVAAGDADDIVGVWATNPDSDVGQAHIEIYEVGGTYEGKIIWMEIPVYQEGDVHGTVGEIKTDTENPDPSLRSRPIVGLKLLFGFQFAGDGNWNKGKIYDPENGKTYKCKIRLTEGGDLKVRGFIGVSLLGRSELWTPVDTGEVSAAMQ